MRYSYINGPDVFHKKAGKHVPTKVAIISLTGKWTGAMLREIRKKNGVGRPPRRQKAS